MLESGGWVTLAVTRVDISQLSADDLMFLARILDTISNYERAQHERRRMRIERKEALDRWADDGGAAARSLPWGGAAVTPTAALLDAIRAPDTEMP